MMYTAVSAALLLGGGYYYFYYSRKKHDKKGPFIKPPHKQQQPFWRWLLGWSKPSVKDNYEKAIVEDKKKKDAIKSPDEKTPLLDRSTPTKRRAKNLIAKFETLEAVNNQKPKSSVDVKTNQRVTSDSSNSATATTTTTSTAASSTVSTSASPPKIQRCPVCRTRVSDTSPSVQYDQFTLHRKCFTCRDCDSNLYCQDRLETAHQGKHNNDIHMYTSNGKVQFLCPLCYSHHPADDDNAPTLQPSQSLDDSQQTANSHKLAMPKKIKRHKEHSATVPTKIAGQRIEIQSHEQVDTKAVKKEIGDDLEMAVYFMTKRCAVCGGTDFNHNGKYMDEGNTHPKRRLLFGSTLYHALCFDTGLPSAADLAKVIAEDIKLPPSFCAKYLPQQIILKLVTPAAPEGGVPKKKIKRKEAYLSQKEWDDSRVTLTTLYFVWKDRERQAVQLREEQKDASTVVVPFALDENAPANPNYKLLQEEEDADATTETVAVVSDDEDANNNNNFKLNSNNNSKGKKRKRKLVQVPYQENNNTAVSDATATLKDLLQMELLTPGGVEMAPRCPRMPEPVSLSSMTMVVSSLSASAAAADEEKQHGSEEAESMDQDAILETEAALALEQASSQEARAQQQQDQNAMAAELAALLEQVPSQDLEAKAEQQRDEDAIPEESAAALGHNPSQEAASVVADEAKQDEDQDAILAADAAAHDLYPSQEALPDPQDAILMTMTSMSSDSSTSSRTGAAEENTSSLAGSPKRYLLTAKLVYLKFGLQYLLTMTIPCTAAASHNNNSNSEDAMMQGGDENENQPTPRPQSSQLELELAGAELTVTIQDKY